MKIIFVDDSTDDLRIFSVFAKNKNISHICFSDPLLAIEHIKQNQSEKFLIVCDVFMPQMNGFDFLDAIQKLLSHSPIIFTSGAAEIDIPIRALRSGALDYLPKPIGISELETRIYRAIKLLSSAEISNAIGIPEKLQPMNSKYSYVIGKNEDSQKLMAFIERLSPFDSSVFITGESGVGKENIARLIHQKSPRGNRDFTAINCASIPENLVESELFGHVKGAFTSADRDNPGLFVNAHMGTLFLDEVAELSLSVQAKLLRVLQEMEVRPVGGKKSVPVDVRVICATHRNIHQMIQDEAFRSDLFYRLNVIPINIKPLRERPEDLKQLISHFMQKMSSRFKIQKSLSDQALQFLKQYHYPGNVRELQNLIERAFILSTNNSIEVSDFNLQPSTPIASSTFFKLGPIMPTLEQVEMAYIKEVLDHNQSKKKAAEILGIGRKTLFRKELTAKQSV